MIFNWIKKFEEPPLLKWLVVMMDERKTDVIEGESTEERAAGLAELTRTASKSEPENPLECEGTTEDGYKF